MAKSKTKLRRRFKDVPRTVGVIHLPALPGSPGGACDVIPSEYLERVAEHVVKEARVLSKASFDALILENFGDLPFHKARVGLETVSAMTLLAYEIRRTLPRLTLGINVLRNDGLAALAIATTVGADFIRINVLSGVAASDQGWIEGEAATILRERSRMHSPVAILGDVQVKHATTVHPLDLEIALEEVGLRALADGVILSGATTGRAPSLERLRQAHQVTARLQVPLYLGSGFNIESAHEVLPFVDSVIVGSALRVDGKAGNPLESVRIKQVLRAMKENGFVG